MNYIPSRVCYRCLSTQEQLFGDRREHLLRERSTTSVCSFCGAQDKDGFQSMVWSFTPKTWVRNKEQRFLR